MNDGNIRDYLRRQIQELAKDIKIAYQDIEGWNRRIDDEHKKIKTLRVHYTSLINTLLAYDDSEEQMRDDGWVVLDEQDTTT